MSPYLLHTRRSMCGLGWLLGGGGEWVNHEWLAFLWILINLWIMINSQFMSCVNSLVWNFKEKQDIWNVTLRDSFFCPYGIYILGQFKIFWRFLVILLATFWSLLVLCCGFHVSFWKLLFLWLHHWELITVEIDMAIV